MSALTINYFPLLPPVRKKKFGVGISLQMSHNGYPRPKNIVQCTNTFLSEQNFLFYPIVRPTHYRVNLSGRIRLKLSGSQSSAWSHLRRMQRSRSRITLFNKQKTSLLRFLLSLWLTNRKMSVRHNWRGFLLVKHKRTSKLGLFLIFSHSSELM